MMTQEKCPGFQAETNSAWRAKVKFNKKKKNKKKKGGHRGKYQPNSNAQTNPNLELVTLDVDSGF